MNVFDLAARISLDSSEYDRGLDEASTASSNFASKIGGGLAAVGKAGAVAIGAGATAVGALAKQATEAYGEYEQLAGGVEKLFGEDVARTVEENANNAFKTAGMNANEYMETVTGFSAALIKSVGGDTAKAAELADMAIIDMSDNANVFGSDIESLQNAYSGFSRQNYTMLDNLRLGYAGTKEGMQQLLDDANELAKQQGINADYQIDSYADIVEAIHRVQEAQNIADATRLEAEGTIQGSLASTKSAWDNLVAGFGKGVDLGPLIENLVESAGNLVTNVMPIIEQALMGIASFVEQIAPIIAERLPALVETILPSAVSAITALIQGVIAVLPSLLQTVMDVITNTLPQVITAITAILPEIIAVITGMIPQATQAAIQIIMALIDGFAQALPSLIVGFTTMIAELAIALSNPDTLNQFIMGALAIIEALAQGIIKAIPVIMEALPQIVDNIIKFFTEHGPDIAKAGYELLMKLIDQLPSVLTAIVTGVGKILSSIISAIKKGMPVLVTAGKNYFTGFLNGLIKVASEIMKKIGELIKKIPETLMKGVNNMKTVGRNLMQGLKNGIIEKVNEIINVVQNTINDIISKAKNILRISSPSKVFRWIGEMTMAGMEESLESGGKEAVKTMQGITGDIIDAADIGSIPVAFDDITSPVSAVTGTTGINGAMASARDNNTAILQAILQAVLSLDLTIDGEKLSKKVSGYMNNDLGVLVQRSNREAFA